MGVLAGNRRGQELDFGLPSLGRFVMAVEQPDAARLLVLIIKQRNSLQKGFRS